LITEFKKRDTISRIFSGGGHCYALAKNGTLFSWGYGIYGVLGHGDQLDVLAPKPIQFFKGMKVLDVIPGTSHAFVIVEDD